MRQFIFGMIAAVAYIILCVAGYCLCKHSERKRVKQREKERKELRRKMARKAQGLE